MHRQNCTITRILIHFFSLYTEFHVARMQTKFCRSCPHHIKGWVPWFRRLGELCSSREPSRDSFSAIHLVTCSLICHGSHNAMITASNSVIIIIIIIRVINFLQSICKYIPETNQVFRVWSVAALLYLQFVLHVMLFRPWNMFCTFTLALSAVCVQCPIWLFLVVL